MYTELPRIYDLFMDNMEYGSWAQYLLGFLDESCEKGCSVLDMGCGTGALSIPIAKAGYSVIAADMSEGMLMQAGENARKAGTRIQFMQTDAREFALARLVDAIVCACDVVNYLLDEEEIASFLQCAHKALKPGGRLLFDISSRYYYQNVLGSGTYAREKDEAVYIMQTEYEEGANAHMVMDVTFFEEQENGSYLRFEEQHIMAAHEETQLMACLENAGFDKMNTYGFGTRQPPKPDETRIQFVAHRA